MFLHRRTRRSTATGRAHAAAPARVAISTFRRMDGAAAYNPADIITAGAIARASRTWPLLAGRSADRVPSDFGLVSRGFSEHLCAARSKRRREFAEAPRPRRALRRSRRNDQRLAPIVFLRRVINRRGGGQLNPARTIFVDHLLDRAVCPDRADSRINALEHALRFADGIGQNQTRAPRRLIAAPPIVDLGKNCLWIRPAINGQAKGRFADKGVAAHRLELFTGWIGPQFVIA